MERTGTITVFTGRRRQAEAARRGKKREKERAKEREKERHEERDRKG